MKMMERLKRFAPIVLVVFLGILAWIFLNREAGRMAEPPLAEENYHANIQDRPPDKTTAPAPRNSEDAGQENSYQGRGRFQTEIDPRFRNDSSPRIIDALIAADASGDRETVLVALATLERRAQLGDDQVPRLLLDSLDKFPAEKQKALVRIVGRIATPSALDALFEIARPETGRLAGLRTEALAEIEKVGTHIYDNGDYPVELSPVLEKRLPQVLEDAELLAAVSGGIASIGTASGVEALLGVIENHLDTPESTIVARQLGEVRNPDAVGPLAARLRADAGTLPPIGEIAGDVLAALGDPAATDALLAWAADAQGEQAHELALKWFGQVRDDASFDQVAEADTRYRFRDPRLLDAIQTFVRDKDEQTQPYIEGPGGD
jgi:hypothetical protein